MADAIRPTEGDAWIPRPRRVGAQRRREDDDPERAFDEALERGTLMPRERSAGVDDDDQLRGAARRARGEDGLGGDLDLLA